MTHHTDAQLLPCPFCCAGITSIRENGKMWTGQRYSEPTSVSVMHHCEPVDGQPSRAIERVGRDMESAVAAWNRRAPAAPVQMPQPVAILSVGKSGIAMHLYTARPLDRFDIGNHDLLLASEARAMLAAAPQPPEAAPVQLPEQLARNFHAAYEHLAPSFGYETRKETRTFDPESANGKLMIAVCAELLAANGIKVNQ